jgi:DNA-binding transcriptional LysR family regulator
MRTLGIGELEAVLAVARNRSFRIAAIELEMSTSALSQSIALTESRIGVQLFNRTTRSVSLTDAGSQYVEAISPAVLVIRDATQIASSLKNIPRGRLRITAPVGATRQAMPMLLAFMQQYTDVELDIKGEDRKVDIVAEGFDIGIRYPSQVPKDMIAVPYGRPQRGVVVGTPDYFGRRPAPCSPSQLLHHECIRHRLPDGSIDPWDFEYRGKKTKIEPTGKLTVNSSHLVREAVLSGAGIAFINEWHVLADVGNKSLVSVLGKCIPAYDRLCLYFPNRRHMSNSMQMLIAFARGWNP